MRRPHHTAFNVDQVIELSFTGLQLYTLGDRRKIIWTGGHSYRDQNNLLSGAAREASPITGSRFHAEHRVTKVTIRYMEAHEA